MHFDGNAARKDFVILVNLLFMHRLRAHSRRPEDHSVEPGQHQLISVVPRPVQRQLKHRGRAQSTETSENSLSEQAPKTHLLESDDSEIS